MTPSVLVDGYCSCERICDLQLHLNLEASRCPEVLVSTYRTAVCHVQQTTV